MIPPLPQFTSICPEETNIIYMNYVFPGVMHYNPAKKNNLLVKCNLKHTFTDEEVFV